MADVKPDADKPQKFCKDGVVPRKTPLSQMKVAKPGQKVSWKNKVKGPEASNKNSWRTSFLGGSGLSTGTDRTICKMANNAVSTIIILLLL